MMNLVLIITSLNLSYSQIFTNSFSLKSESLSLLDPFGTGIYLSASYFDHSCQPNARAIFTGRQLNIMATKDIYISNQTANKDLVDAEIRELSSQVSFLLHF